MVWFSWLYSGVAYAAFTVLLLTCSRQLFGIFTSDAGVIELAPVFVRAAIWGFPAMALMRGTTSFIQGIGNARLSLVLALLDGFAMRILLSWFIGVHMGFGLFGFFLGYALAAYGTSVPAAVYFFSGIWEKRASAAEKLKKT